MSGGWQALRETDRDLALALLFAPAASRDLIADRLSLAIEAETAMKLASEPMLAAIRLQWWVEAIQNVSGESVPLMERLLDHLDRGSLASADLVAQMELWQDRLSTSPENSPNARGDCWADCFGALLPPQEQAARQVGRALVDPDARIGDEALGLLATAEGRWLWMIGMLVRHRRATGGAHDDPLMAWRMVGWRFGFRQPLSPTTSR